MPVTRTTRSSAAHHITTTSAKTAPTSAAPSVGEIVLDLSLASSAFSAETSERDSSSAGSGSGSATSKQKRYRDRVDGELEKLQELWDRTQYPPRKERAGLATALGIDIKIVDIWFQNKRRAIKKQQPKEVEYIQNEQSRKPEMTTQHEATSTASLDLSVSVYATAESSPPSIAPVNSVPQDPSSPSSRVQSPCIISRPLDGFGSHLLPLKDMHQGNHGNAISALAPAATISIPLLQKLKSLPPDPRSSHYASSTNNRYALVPALFPPQASFSALSPPVTILKTPHRDSHGVQPKHSQTLLPSALISSNFSLSENSHPRVHHNAVKKVKHNTQSTGALDKACEERRRRHKQHRERRPHKGHKKVLGGFAEQQPRTIEEKGSPVNYDDSGYASDSDATNSRFLESDVRTSSEPELVYSPRMTEAAQILMSFKTGRIF